MKNKIIIVDIDGTICNSNNSDYKNSIPNYDRISKINQLYEENTIIYWTARGGFSGIDWSELTKKQLNDWGCKFHELRMSKPVYDMWIDDKAENCNAYFGDRV